MPIIKLKNDIDAKLRQYDRQYQNLIQSFATLIDNPSQQGLQDLSADLSTIATTIISPLNYALRAFYFAKYNELRPDKPITRAGDRNDFFKFENYKSQSAYQSDKVKNITELKKGQYLVSLENSTYTSAFEAHFDQQSFRNEVANRLHELSNFVKHQGIDLVNLVTAHIENVQVKEFETGAIVSRSPKMQVELPEEMEVGLHSTQFPQSGVTLFKADLGLRYLNYYQVAKMPFRANPITQIASEYYEQYFLFKAKGNNYVVPQIAVEANTFNPLEVLFKSRIMVSQSCMKIVECL